MFPVQHKPKINNYDSPTPANRSAFFLHLFSNHVKHLEVAVQHSAAVRKLDMERLLLLVSHLVISSKWLPKIFIQIFKEYSRAKLQAPVVAVVRKW